MSAPLAAAASPRFAVIGLGYVGLPLAVAFGRHWPTLGFDIDADRIAELRDGQDHTLEMEADELASAQQLQYGSDPALLDACNVYIVTVPTPIDAYEQPDLEPLRSATRLIASHLRAGDLVIYESTVYPGTTEEVCVPLLEQLSGLRFNEDFYCGYSPERVSPGDRQRRLADIRKITSGSTPEVAAVIDGLYQRIIAAGTFPAPSMRVAEAAKVVENIQRDVNIALVNELALIFDRLGIDTRMCSTPPAAVELPAIPAGPGWRPLHRRGPVLPAAQVRGVGYHPDLIHTARQVNNRVGEHVASRVLAMLAERGRAPAQSRILVLGVTFKEDCPDLRNSRALELAQRLRDAGAQVEVSDPWVGPAALADAGVHWLAEPVAGSYDAVVLAVAHARFKAMDDAAIQALLAPGGIVYDVKSAWPRNVVDGRL